MQYLGPDLDRRLEQELKRRRRHKLVVQSLLLAPVALLGFLIATPVASESVSADIESSGASFVLASERELFGERPRLQSFTASGFSQLSLPGFAFPLRPAPDQEAVVRAEAADSGSWISLQPWNLSEGALVTWDHPLGAKAGEYTLSLVNAGADRARHVDLVHRITLSRFGLAAELRDYADTSALQLASSTTPLELALQFREPSRFTEPRFPVHSVQLIRKGFGDSGPMPESTVLSARLHFDGRDTSINRTHLSLGGLFDAQVDQLRLIDSGIAFSLTGTAKHIAIGGRTVEFPSRLEWLFREQPLALLAGALAYVLLLLTALIGWRTTHASKPIAS
jgi:hypothetical protein